MSTMAKQKKWRDSYRGGQARSRKATRVSNDADTRNRYTVLEKINIVEYTQVCMEEDKVSLSVVADEVGVSVSTLWRWCDQISSLREVRKSGESKRSLGKGRVSMLEEIASPLLSFIDELRESGYAVSRKMIVAHSCRLLGPDHRFSLATYAAKAVCVSRWMAQNGLTIRAGTHQAQVPPQAVMVLASDFIFNIARPAVEQDFRDRRYILNMDQTPVFFSMHSTKSVDKIGTRTVNIRIAKNASQRATVAVCFTASGYQLPSLIIFKGKS